MYLVTFGGIFEDLILESICSDTTNPFPISSISIGFFTNRKVYESTQENIDSTNDTRVVAMFFGPYRGTQALYMIQNGSENSVIRIRYTGLAPVAVIGIGNKMQYEKNKIVLKLQVNFMC